MKTTSGYRLIKNSLFTLFNSAFMMLTSWIISIWVARQLGPANYGIFSLVLWLTGTITWIIGMGLIHAVTKFIAEFQGKNDTKSFTPIVLYVLKIELILTCIVFVILILFSTPIADYFFSPNESFFFLLAAFGLVPGIITAIFSAAIEGIQKFEYFTISNLILSPLSFGAKAAVLISGKGIPGLLMVMIVFSFVNFLFYFFVLKKEGFFVYKTSCNLENGIKEKILQYNKSVLAILLCDKIVWDKSENLFLGRLCSSQEIGFYNLGYNIAQKIITLLPSTFWRVLFPAMSSYSGSDDVVKMRRVFLLSTRYLTFVTFPIGMTGIILSYQILHFLYGHDYVGSQRVLQIICAGSLISTLSGPASAVLYGFNKQSFIYKFGAVLAIFNILLDIALIRKYGAIGAALAYALTTVLASTGGLIYTCNKMKLDYPIVSVFKIFLATIVMATTMETIIINNGELPGFIISIFAGIIVYLVSALVLGTFESEDFELLHTIQSIVPRKFQKPIGSLGKFVMQFKNKQ